ncbi:hypothetical protein, partial [Legionella parisiensis]|uniref:hypothetical protein n=1 Tax=Legionella parisiensis TaxID=45071 RepID=UPI0014716033
KAGGFSLFAAVSSTGTVRLIAWLRAAEINQSSAGLLSKSLQLCATVMAWLDPGLTKFALEKIASKRSPKFSDCALAAAINIIDSGGFHNF